MKRSNNQQNKNRTRKALSKSIVHKTGTGIGRALQTEIPNSIIVEPSANSNL